MDEHEALRPADEHRIHEHWGVAPDRVVPLTGGMNSAAWRVEAGGRRWALKVVSERDACGFVAGLHAALVLEAGGLAAGGPVATRDGAWSVVVPDGRAALLTWVEGAELAGEGADVALIGRTLARAHVLLRGADVPDPAPFDWIDPAAPHLEVEPWVRPAVIEVLAQWAQVRAGVTTWGFLHGDPSPGAFLLDPASGTCGLIDWGGGVHGPLLYDLASAGMYVGPDAVPELVAAYRGAGVVTDEEIGHGLATLLRLRYAVQADYFARRLHEDDRTGLADAAGNRTGLADARRMLARAPLPRLGS